METLKIINKFVKDKISVEIFSNENELKTGLVNASKNKKDSLLICALSNNSVGLHIYHTDNMLENSLKT